MPFDVKEIGLAANAVVKAVTDAGGPALRNALPDRLLAIADGGAKINGNDLHYILGMIMVMQKNIFSDLMPMHAAYVDKGLPAIAEMRDSDSSTTRSTGRGRVSRRRIPTGSPRGTPGSCAANGVR